MSFTMTEQAKARLKKSIEKQVSVAAKDIVKTCMKEIVNSTPMNSGRTIASWHLFKGTPGAYDAGADYGDDFKYNSADMPHTNDLMIGTEPGRQFWEKHAMSSLSTVDFKNPYNVYYITNGAGLDSMGESDLDQSLGSRAAYLDAGEIPEFDNFTKTHGRFDPGRADGFFRLTARNRIKSKLRERRS